MKQINDIQNKIVYSGLKPTGDLTIGNYIGALKNMIALTKENTCLYNVADLHALTIDNDPGDLRRRTLDSMALFHAVGLGGETCTLFVQSHVPAHAELAWVLNCYTQFGEARRMTQFKDKSQKAPQNINVGLFAYPTLMAADILLYQAEYVPVGKDQVQHVELSRTIAERFNNRYSPTFAIPECVFPGAKSGAKIYSLTDPTAKMGKSEGDENGTVFLLDGRDAIMRKFKRAVTDSQTEVRFDPVDKPGVSNLLTIYAVMTGRTVAEAESDFLSANYAVLKEGVGEAVANVLAPIQERFRAIREDKTALERLMRDGAARASAAARKTLSKVYKKMGLVPLPGL